MHPKEIIRGVLEGYLVHPNKQTNNPGCTGEISGAPYNITYSRKTSQEGRGGGS